jgi:hypothetical protein
LLVLLQPATDGVFCVASRCLVDVQFDISECIGSSKVDVKRGRRVPTGIPAVTFEKPLRRSLVPRI